MLLHAPPSISSTSTQLLLVLGVACRPLLLRLLLLVIILPRVCVCVRARARAHVIAILRRSPQILKAQGVSVFGRHTSAGPLLRLRTEGLGFGL